MDYEQTAAAGKEAVMDILQEVKDPEVPVLSVVELGVVRDVKLKEGHVEVVITPTYSGCPAMQAIREGIINALRSHGFDKASTRTVLSPPWTTDWMSEEAKGKLREYGIAPPGHTRDREDRPVACPFCDSEDTALRSEFGSTACKALYFCNACQQPFEQFKCI
ncbi:MAG TPA: 1,2-phenylacetyl-CoA epoxidase subunit PaaD [Acidobacteriota bacterium]|nr:1,2-phenylacetyl-CoA epoxidase subunit PaaD [Acidobacteriota bacterium]